MRLMSLFATLFFLLSPAFGSPPDSTACEKEAVFLMPRVGRLLSGSTSENADRLGHVCRELERSETFLKIPVKDLLQRRDLRKFAFLIERQSKEIKSKYRDELSKLKKISNRDQRITRAYEFATRVFGEFDLSQLDTLCAENNLWNRQAQRAALLAMSLERMQVSPIEFSVSLMSAFPNDSEKRSTWVRIELPRRGSASMVFDFDPSVTGVVPAPLVARYEALSDSDRTQIKIQCDQTKLCFLNLEMSNKVKR